uniref:Uncharacterized protein n=1 Tax=Anguilla anguilla TaxID=7936 RepID=A0A0E9QLY5_ANGAN
MHVQLLIFQNPYVLLRAALLLNRQLSFLQTWQKSRKKTG